MRIPGQGSAPLRIKGLPYVIPGDDRACGDP
jgi:hypothetical protein